MLNPNGIKLVSDQDELKGFARTIAEIEWLLLVLVLVYLVAVHPEGDGDVAIYAALFFLAAFILSFHYINFYKEASFAKITVETTFTWFCQRN